MRILLAPDKFKGSLTAHEVCEISATTLLSIFPKAEIMQVPMADGGEGTSAVLAKHFEAKSIEIIVQNPLMREIKAIYYYSVERKEAYIEMANASGLLLLKEDERQGLLTNTYGTGEMIQDAINKGAKNLILCIGGSATNDAGTGMAFALGYRFLNKAGYSFIPNGKTLIEIVEIIPPSLDFKEQLKTTILSAFYR
jgi:glycerate kinase